MQKQKLFQAILIIILIILLYLSFLIIKPFLTPILLSFVIAYLFYPVYSWLKSRLSKHFKGLHAKTRERLASVIMVTLIFLIIVVPSAFLITTLIQQTTSTYQLLQGMKIGNGLNSILSHWGLTFSGVLEALGKNLQQYIVTSASNIISGVTSLFIDLSIFFFLLFFVFIEGKVWVTASLKSIPLKKEHKEGLFDQVQNVTHAILYGYFLTAVIQGLLGAVMLLIFRVPNALFWGVVMMILSFLPIVGTPIVWIPIALVELIKSNYIAGVGILVIGFLILINVDNFIRPKLIGKKAKLSTPLVFLGVLGGLALFGFIGIILGPLVLALLITTIDFFSPRSQALSRK